MKHRYIFSTALAFAFVAWQALSLRANAQETDKWITVLHETFDSFTKGTNNTANAPSEDLKIPADATLKDLTSLSRRICTKPVEPFFSMVIKAPCLSLSLWTSQERRSRSR